MTRSLVRHNEGLEWVFATGVSWLKVCPQGVSTSGVMPHPRANPASEW